MILLTSVRSPLAALFFSEKSDQPFGGPRDTDLVPSTMLEAIGSGCARLRDLSLMCWGEPLYGFTHPWFDFEDVGAVLGDSFPGLTRLEVVMDGKVGDADAQASALASRLAGTLRDLSIHGWVHPVGDA